MTGETKTHYRKVFKSDHLGIADLEDFIEEKRTLIFTIREVKQFTLTNDPNSGVVVAGKRISANIAFFKESIKPLVLNATNSKVVKSFANNSPFVEDWKNITIEIYADYSVKMKGEIVGGLRIRPTQPIITKETLSKSHNKWNDVAKRVKAGVTIEQVRLHYDISDSNFELLKK